MLPKSLRPLLPYIKRYRWSYALGTLCVLLTNGIWILFPLVLGRAADDLYEGVSRHKLLVYAGVLLAIATTKGIFQFLTRWIVIGISRDVEFDLRNDLVRAPRKLSPTRTTSAIAPATLWRAPPTTSTRSACCLARPSCIRLIPSFTPRARWPS